MFSIDIERDIIVVSQANPIQDFRAPSRRQRRFEPHQGNGGRRLTEGTPDVLAVFGKTDDKANFGWIDQIRHVRDKALIEKLDVTLAAALQGALPGPTPTHFTWPIPSSTTQKARHIEFKGLRSTNINTDTGNWRSCGRS